MSSEGDSDDIADVPALDDAEDVARIIYDPEHIVDGAVIPSAISVSDLKSSGFSLNRHFVERAVVERMISDAQASKPAERAGAMVSTFNAGTVRGLTGVVPNKKLAKGQLPTSELLFEAMASPDPGDDRVTPPFPPNPAHAHVLCLHRGEGTIKKLRDDHLLPLLQPPKDLAPYLAGLTDSRPQEDEKSAD